MIQEGDQDTLAAARFVLGKHSDSEFAVNFRQPFSCLEAFAMTYELPDDLTPSAFTARNAKVTRSDPPALAV
eukprot:7073643-Prymnesium_polylepis.1